MHEAGEELIDRPEQAVDRLAVLAAAQRQQHPVPVRHRPDAGDESGPRRPGPAFLRPFTVSIPDQEIDDLKQRLARTAGRTTFTPAITTSTQAQPTRHGKSRARDSAQPPIDSAVLARLVRDIAGARG